jgi:plastocyanin
MRTSRVLLSLCAASAVAAATACGGDRVPLPPNAPTPPPAAVTANAYILPGAVSSNDWAFGDEPIVVHPGERLRWVNADTVVHDVVADAPDATDFRRTGDLPPGAEHAFPLTRSGTTRIHCARHPNMTGILIVRER